jgi:hypothetical protein
MRILLLSLAMSAAVSAAYAADISKNPSLSLIADPSADRKDAQQTRLTEPERAQVHDSTRTRPKPVSVAG